MATKEAAMETIRCGSCDRSIGEDEWDECPLCGEDIYGGGDELSTDEEIEWMLRQQRAWEEEDKKAQKAAQRYRRKTAQAAKTKKRLKRAKRD